MRKTAIALLASALLCQSVQAKENRQERQVREMVSRAPEALMPLMTVTGDELDPRIEVSSYGVSAYVSKGLLSTTTTEDSWLRGSVSV